MFTIKILIKFCVNNSKVWNKEIENFWNFEIKGKEELNNFNLLLIYF